MTEKGNYDRVGDEIEEKESIKHISFVTDCLISYVGCLKRMNKLYLFCNRDDIDFYVCTPYNVI